MSARIGINGFGRIGRLTLRASLSYTDLDVVLVNDPFMTADHMKYLLEFDSVHGRLCEEVSVVDEKTLKIGSRLIQLSFEKDPSQIPWGKSSVDVVLECTGVFTSTEKAGQHLQSGAKLVIISAPPSDDTPIFVFGVNHEKYSKDVRVVSNASCTTNCLAPLIKVIEESFGIVEGMVTTVHSVTSNQLTVDGAPRGGKDWRAGRCAFTNIIPASTGVNKAFSKVFPHLDGKFAGMAFRVPVSDVSVVDFTCKLKTPAKFDKIVERIKAASHGELKGILGYTEEASVSSDFIHDKRSSIFDIKASVPLSDTFVKLVSWYDNEWGFSNRILDLALYIHSKQ